MSRQSTRLFPLMVLGLVASSVAQDTIFNNANPLSTGFGTSAVIVSDIDGGGRPDVAIGQVDPVMGTDEVIMMSSETGAVIQRTGSFGLGVGSALCNVGDVTGGPNDDILASLPGVPVVFIFSGDFVGPTGIITIVPITIPTPASGDMVLVNDVNGDGVRDVAIGDPVNNLVYIVDLVGQTVLYTITDSRIGSLGAAMAFGSSNRLAVGAPTWSNTVPPVNTVGYVNIYKLAATTAFLGRTLTPAPVPAVPVEFGRSLANVGDLDGDSMDDYAVLCPSGTAANGFAAFVSENNPAILGQFNYGFATPPGQGRIASMGDIDGDGRSEVMMSDSGNLRVLTTPLGGPLTALATANVAGVFDGALSSGKMFNDGFVDVIAARDTTLTTATVRVQPVAAFHTLPNPPACTLTPPVQPRPILGTGIYPLTVSTTSSTSVVCALLVDFAPALNIPLGNGIAYLDSNSSTVTVLGIAGVVTGSPVTFNTSVLPPASATNFLNVGLIYQAVVFPVSGPLELSNGVLVRLGER